MTSHTFRCGALACGVLFVVSVSSATAQQTVGDVLTFLVTNQGVATGNPQIDRAAAQATSETISRALLANVATLPVTSSSGAFVYQLNPELGTVERATESFGPFFVERATTRGRAFTQASASATAVGLADMVLRTKYTVFSDHGSGVAAAVDLRLPTGKQENLLGAGSASVRFSGIASAESGRTTVHANGGYTVGGLAREVRYGGAVGIAATNRVTVSGGLLGRRIDGIGRIAPTSAPTPGLVGVETIRLVPDASALDILTAVPGVKWNVTDTWILVGNVSVPLTDAG